MSTSVFSQQFENDTMIARPRPNPPEKFVRSRHRKNAGDDIAKLLNSYFSTNEAPNIPIKHRMVDGLIDDIANSFGNKCPFCECKLTTSDEVDLLFFRPLNNSLQVREGVPDKWHYFWLVWEWSNIFPACLNCVAIRGRWFPTEFKERTKIGAVDEEELSDEGALILDPCRDNPMEHLLFLEDGRIEPKYNSTKGDLTIKAFDLNRENLVTARSESARLLKDEWRSTIQATGGVQSKTPQSLHAILNLLKIAGIDQEFAGLKRQLLRSWLDVEIVSEGKSPHSILENSPWQLLSWLDKETIPIKHTVTGNITIGSEFLITELLDLHKSNIRLGEQLTHSILELTNMMQDLPDNNLSQEYSLKMIDVLILEPNFSGIGIDLMKLKTLTSQMISNFKQRRNRE